MHAFEDRVDGCERIRVLVQIYADRLEAVADLEGGERIARVAKHEAARIGQAERNGRFVAA